MKISISSFLILFFSTANGQFSQLADMGPSINTTMYKGTLDIPRSDLQEHLTCDFSTPCAYGPNDPDSHWVILNSLDTDWNKWQSAMGTSSSPTAPFVATDLRPEQPFGVLKSQNVPCLENGGEVMFTFWATQNVTIQVCIVNAASGQSIICSPIYDQSSDEYSSFLSLKIQGAVCESFTIEYMAWTDSHSKGFVILDELSFFGTICGNPKNLICSPFTKESTVSTMTTESITDVTRRPAYQPQPVSEISKISRLVSQVDICHALNCDFSTDLCSYRNFEGAIAWSQATNQLGIELADQLNTLEQGYANLIISSFKTICLGEWCKQMLHVGNPTTRILQITLDPQLMNHMAVVSSPRFTPSSGRQLSFKYFRLLSTQILKICFETYPNPEITDISVFRNCPNTMPEWNLFNALTWHSHTVNIPENAYRVHFVAYLQDYTMPIGFPVAIDEITINKCD